MPSGLQARQETSWVCPLRTVSGVPSGPQRSTSGLFRRASASRRPSGRTATLSISGYPVNVTPGRAFEVPDPQVARAPRRGQCLPSGLHARQKIGANPEMTLPGVPSAPQSRMLLSSLAEAMRLPSGLQASAVTFATCPFKTGPGVP